MGKTVASIDPSWTSCGVADALGNTHRFRTKAAMEDLLRLDMIIYQSLSMCFGVDLVVVEGYAYGAKMGREKMGWLGESLQAELRRFSIPYIVLPPTKLKQFATGNGSATKKDMKEAAVRLLDLPDGVSHDEADAAWLRAAGLHLLGASSYIPPSDRAAVLEDIELPTGET